MAVLVQFLNRLAVFVQPAGSRPVPPGFGRHATPGKGRDVAALAGKFVYVFVQLGLVVWLRPWHDSQLAREKSVWPGTSIPRVSRALAWYRLPDTAWPVVVWQSEQPKLRPSGDICTSSSFGGLISEESRSPCFTPSAPPPWKWQLPQLARPLAPTFWAMRSRSGG